MPDQRRHRGPHPHDRTLFAEERLPVLKAATADLCWLLSRGYAGPSSLKLVGDRYDLASRQRTAVSRSVCTVAQQEERSRKRRAPADVAGEPLWIDGYNVLTSIEAALSGGVLLRGVDGCIRDMASMHGSYRKVEETVPAVALIGDQLAEWRIGPCRWLLDQPVSNSGRLRTIMAGLAADRGWEWEVDLVPDPDPMLVSADVCVATADSAILDQTQRWLNLVKLLVTSKISDAWIVDLSA